MTTAKLITIQFDCGLESQEETENFFWSIVQSGVLNADRGYQAVRWPRAQEGPIRLKRADPFLERVIVPDTKTTTGDHMSKNPVASFLEAYIKNAGAKEGSWSADDFGVQIKEGMHLSGVVVSPCDAKASKTAIITSDGVEFIDAVCIRRGVRVAIAFTSEHGDSFIREFHFHKGDTYSKDVPAVNGLPLSADAPLDIWRD